MFEILRKSLATGIVTTAFPPASRDLPRWRRGQPEINFSAWKDMKPAVAACPTGALSARDENGKRVATLDLAKCTFCGLCAEAEPAIQMSTRAMLAARRRAELITTAKYAVGADGLASSLLEVSQPGASPIPLAADDEIELLASALQTKIQRVLGRSLHIREVDAGSCNGCEMEIVGLNSPIYDIERFGIHFVASPRHADMLLVTGPVTRNMELALRKTYDAMPEPRLVVAVGACGCSGGIFGENYACLGGVDKVLPVDIYVPGCPPNPYALLQGILMAVGRLGPGLSGKERSAGKS